MATETNTTAADLGEAVEQAKTKVRSKAKEIVEQGQHAASSVADNARGTVKTQLTGQKDNVADHLLATAQAIQSASDQLKEHGTPFVGEYADKAAASITEFSGALKDKQVEQIVADTEAFARRSPGLYLGAAAVAGLLAARFLKSSGTGQPSAGR
ncbi:hypothetical protein CCAX7_53040 [Capsulimonas corticalis]|uniref:Uncharacterized protein n=1 Tax=Capsulimonas corticalis TaxID=2219043 RepID=A0A402CNR7_9BACT|nr:hypothetical protein [Capsulimonas corticalis]BDI33253.1 hypothetical protein CCAX7_53040 [Capsulimonas corticalis]